jgi:hypothetical protein
MISSIRLPDVFLGRVWYAAHSFLIAQFRSSFFTGDSSRVCNLTLKFDCFGLMFSSEDARLAPLKFQALLRVHKKFPGSCALTKTPSLGAGDDAIIHA